MSLAQVPSKIIETAESLMENKLNISAHLTRLCSERDIDKQTVLDTYLFFYNKIKQETPPSSLQEMKKGCQWKWIFITHALAFVSGIVAAFFWR